MEKCVICEEGGHMVLYAWYDPLKLFCLLSCCLFKEPDSTCCWRQVLESLLHQMPATYCQDLIAWLQLQNVTHNTHRLLRGCNWSLNDVVFSCLHIWNSIARYWLLRQPLHCPGNSSLSLREQWAGPHANRRQLFTCQRHAICSAAVPAESSRSLEVIAAAA